MSRYILENSSGEVRHDALDTICGPACNGDGRVGYNAHGTVSKGMLAGTHVRYGAVTVGTRRKPRHFSGSG